MMATQEEIDAARRHTERLRDQHANDVLALVRLVDDGALKGEAGGRLIAVGGGVVEVADFGLHGLVAAPHVHAADATFEGVLAGVEPPVNEWFHLAGVYDATGKVATVYPNGRCHLR
ncbi:MAG: hypothetical protein K0R62_3850 [Nonomuraea muscovyensis]|jgi:hypothetical protein|nr:hypothetical protein [Nonomuraea muscovyensis]